MTDSFGYQKKRIEKLRNLMEENGIDAFLIPPGPNFFYFTGFQTESAERLAILIVTHEKASILSPLLMKEQIEENSLIDEVIGWKDCEDPYRIANEMLEAWKVKSIAVDGNLPYFHYSKLFSTRKFREFLADEMFSKLRKVKDTEELNAISTAVLRSERALEETLNAITVGITEKELAGILGDNMRSTGLDVEAFPSVVAFGSNSAIPHHIPGIRQLNYREPIVIDFGGRFHGYASDTTRTLFLGDPSDEMLKIYEITRNAQETTISDLNTDSLYSDADRIARSVITEEGYGERFIHRVGHGLGISVHEEPYLVPDNREKVLENSVFTIEPGIYLSGKGGVRIEDTVTFRNGKCVSFNKFSKEIKVL